MAEGSEPGPVKLICGAISADADLFEAAARELSRAFGAIDLTGGVTDFDFTNYYDAEMGHPLYRQFFAFAELVQPDALVEAKLRTNQIERALAGSGEPALPAGRPINLDPGYVAESKLVLASMKDFSHRIYLGRRVYAEVTLLYRAGKWRPLGWTFPDYASGRYDRFLTAARAALREARRLRLKEPRE